MPFLARDALFAGYRILRFIGEGPRCEVYEAEGPGGEAVALKVVKPGFALTSKSQARIAQEGEVIAAIEHVNVVGFRGADIADGRVCLALELVRGPNLRQLMVMEGGALPVERAVRIVRQACDGVAAAHAEGITHRDLRPENLLIGPEDLTKVVDFGAANMGSLGVKTTASEGDLHSSLYCAPEHFLCRPLDARSDVYTMGAVLYEVIAGWNPVAPGRTNAMMIAQHHLRNTPVPALDTLGIEVPRDVSEVVRLAMSKAPEERPQMREMAEGLACAQRGLHVRRRAVAGGLALPGRPAALAATELSMMAFAAGGTMRMGAVGEGVGRAVEKEKEGAAEEGEKKEEAGDRRALVGPEPVAGAGVVSSAVPTWRSRDDARVEKTVAMTAITEGGGGGEEERGRGSTTVPVESAAFVGGSGSRGTGRGWLGRGVVAGVVTVGLGAVVIGWWVIGGGGGGVATVGAGVAASVPVVRAVPTGAGSSAAPGVAPSVSPSASAGRVKGAGVAPKGRPVGPRRGP